MEFSSKGVNARGKSDGNVDDTPSPPGWCQAPDVVGFRTADPHAKRRRDEATAKKLANRTAPGLFTRRGGSIRRTRRKCRAVATPARPPRSPVFAGGWRDASDQEELLLRPPGRHLRARLAHEHIDLAPHAEPAGEVHPGLHREPHPGHERTLVGRLEVVDVRARAMQLPINGVPGAVHEILGVSCRADHGARRIVDLRTGGDPSRFPRSEEHTSELQSLAYLVCRLLLEKKKKK